MALRSVLDAPTIVALLLVFVLFFGAMTAVPHMRKKPERLYKKKKPMKREGFKSKALQAMAEKQRKERLTYSQKKAAKNNPKERLTYGVQKKKERFMDDFDAMLSKPVGKDIQTKAREGLTDSDIQKIKLANTRLSQLKSHERFSNMMVPNAQPPTKLSNTKNDPINPYVGPLSDDEVM